MGRPDRGDPQDKPYNEVKRGAEASLVTSMGRMAAHTGQVITLDQMLELRPRVRPGRGQADVPDSPAPLLADKDGKYPMPEPGRKKTREF